MNVFSSLTRRSGNRGLDGVENSRSIPYFLTIGKSLTLRSMRTAISTLYPYPLPPVHCPYLLPPIQCRLPSTTYSLPLPFTPYPLPLTAYPLLPTPSSGKFFIAQPKSLTQ